MFVVADILLTLALCAAMLLVQEWGRRLGQRHRDLDSGDGKSGAGATEGAVFALLGLFLAFTFSGAGARFDTRRQLVVQEANAIGTAWQRISILPETRQEEMRALMREYLDSRLQTSHLYSDLKAQRAASEKTAEVQQRLWATATAAAKESGQVPSFTLVLPALGDMFDLAAKRMAVTRLHPPLVLYIMLAFLALVSALFVGYGMAGRKTRSLAHTLGFAAVTSAALYVILEIEFPRLGFVRVDAADQLLLQLRASMG